MSVDDSRFAAAQRTAANRRGTTSSRLKVWLVIVPTLAFFGFALVGGAAAFGKSDYAQAAKKLPTTGALVLVSAEGEQSWIDRLTASSGKELCVVTPHQLEQVAAHYQVEYITVTVDGHPVQIAKVSGQGANDHDLREYLGDPKLRCKFVREGGVFFLPFDPNIS
jgi:ADP-heptose:LPS heptosyltransferase